MDLAAELETLRALFATRLGQPVEVVRTLREPAAGGPALQLWPYRLSESPVARSLPARGGKPGAPPHPARHVHLLAIASDPGVLGRALAAIHEHPVVDDGGGSRIVTVESLDTEALCRLFTAAGQPMQLALALALQA